MPSSRLSSVRGAPYRSLSLRGHRRTMSKGELDIRLEGGLELVDAERARMAALGALAVRRWAHRGAEVKAQLEERRAGLARVVRVLERAARIPGGDEVIARFRGDEARLLARVRRAVRGTPSGATLEQALAHWQGCADCVSEAGPSLVLCAGERVPQRAGAPHVGRRGWAGDRGGALLAVRAGGRRSARAVGGRSVGAGQGETSAVGPAAGSVPSPPRSRDDPQSHCRP